MKAKFAVMLAPALALGVLAVSAEAQQHRATRLGNPTTRFAKKPPKKPDDVRVLLRSEKMKADVVTILNDAGWRGDLEDFDRAVATAEITEIEIAPGTRLPFMASREKTRGHKAHVLMDVLWAGRKPIKAYAFDLTSKCTKYRVVMPAACGNFWFEDVGKDETGACAPPPPPPVVNVSSTGEACVTQPVEITVSVQNPPADGAITVALNGKELKVGTLTAGSFKVSFPGAPQPGRYEVQATSGGVSSTTTFEVKPCLPTCVITVSPDPATAGKPVSVDLTGSRVAAGVTGGIKSVRVEVLRKDEVVDTFDLSAPTLARNDVVVKKGGTHTLRATVTDEAGQLSTNACQVSFDVKNPFPLFAGVYGGKERLVHDSGPGAPGARCAGLIGAEVGIQPKIGEKAELEASLGVKVNLRDTSNTSVFADLAVNGLLGPAFVGGGVSAWDLTRSNGSRAIALLLQTGVDLTPNGKWQLVAQARAPFNKMDDVDNNYMLWGGVRFRPFSSK
jgi:hypothetical protein